MTEISPAPGGQRGPVALLVAWATLRLALDFGNLWAPLKATDSNSEKQA